MRLSLSNDSRLAPGLHKIFWQDAVGQGKFSLNVEITPGEWPVVKDPDVKSVAVDIATSFEGRLRIYWPKKIKTGNQEPINIPPQGFELTDANGLMGSEDGKDFRPIRITPGLNPALHVMISMPETGFLAITTDEDTDGATVLVDDRDPELVTNKRWGRELKAGRHNIKIAKGGDYFEQERTIEIKKGQRLLLPLQLRPSKASLIIRDSMPGATVSLDGSRIGVIREDGSITYKGISAAPHEITIDLPEHDPVDERREFLAGQSVELSGDQGRPKEYGKVTVKLWPETAKAWWSRSNGAAKEVKDGQTVPLARGEYRFRAQADGFEDGEQLIRVNSGETQSLDLVLRSKISVPRSLPVPSVPVSVIKYLSKKGAALEINKEGILFVTVQLEPKQPIAKWQIVWDSERADFELSKGKLNIRGPSNFKKDLVLESSESISSTVPLFPRPASNIAPWIP